MTCTVCRFPDVGNPILYIKKHQFLHLDTKWFSWIISYSVAPWTLQYYFVQSLHINHTFECMEQLQHNASVNALNRRPWENNAFCSLSVMEAPALCAMHFLRRSLIGCVWVCVSQLIHTNWVKSAHHTGHGHLVKSVLLRLRTVHSLWTWAATN